MIVKTRINYSLEGKILYADTEIEDYLKENYHPPYRIRQYNNNAPIIHLELPGA